MNLGTIEAKPFLPARDFAASKAFYLALGFEIPWSSDALAYVRHGHASFLLQHFHAHAENFMMHLLVENADDWHAHVLASGVVERFGVRVDAPYDRPWGLRDFTLCDPTGVLGASGTTSAAETGGTDRAGLMRPTLRSRETT